MVKSIKQKGYALLIVLMLLGIMSVIVLGVNVIMLNKINSTIATADALVAYYAAESGAEKLLHKDRKTVYNPTNGDIINSADHGADFANGASYRVEILIDSPVSLKSVGTFQKTKRALELNYSN